MSAAKSAGGVVAFAHLEAYPFEGLSRLFEGLLGGVVLLREMAQEYVLEPWGVDFGQIARGHEVVHVAVVGLYACLEILGI